jgi:hypothetical protein
MINLNPRPEEEKKWGCLAYVDDEERKRILDLPFGLFKTAIAALERDIAYAKKKRKGRVS